MITLSPSQQHVIDEFPEFLMNDEKEMTISGFAGSGKSFLVKYLADMGEKQQKLVKLIDPNIPKRNMKFTATTNKAAAVLRNMLSREAKTIHSLLGLTVQNDYTNGRTYLVPSRTDRAEDLENTIVVIDEASMIDPDLLKAIRERVAEFNDCKVIFVGDSYQLPPVMESSCPVFHNNQSVFFLKEIQRQVAGSPIIQLSAKYREMLDDHTLDWPEIVGDGKQVIYYEDKLDFFKAIQTAYLSPHLLDDYKIVAWSNPRVREYNQWIRRLHGYTQPFMVGEFMMTNRAIIIRQNRKDRVLAPTDSFHEITSITPDQINGIDGLWIELESLPDRKFFQPLDWAKADKLANEFKKQAKAGDQSMWVPYFEILQQWVDLRPIHASTVHKAQGSTYREVFVDLSNIGRNTNWREVARLAYVAISRASHTAHIYGGLTMRYNKQPVVNNMEKFTYVNNL